MACELPKRLLKCNRPINTIQDKTPTSTNLHILCPKNGHYSLEKFSRKPD